MASRTALLLELFLLVAEVEEEGGTGKDEERGSRGGEDLSTTLSNRAFNKRKDGGHTPTAARSRSPEEVWWVGFTFGSGGAGCCEYARREHVRPGARAGYSSVLGTAWLVLIQRRDEEAEARGKAARRERADIVYS